MVNGKMPITVCNAAMWTAAAFLNAQATLAIQKTRNGATTAHGTRMIIVCSAETEIYYAE